MLFLETRRVGATEIFSSCFLIKDIYLVVFLSFVFIVVVLIFFTIVQRDVCFHLAVDCYTHKKLLYVRDSLNKFYIKHVFLTLHGLS